MADEEKQGKEKFAKPDSKQFRAFYVQRNVKKINNDNSR